MIIGGGVAGLALTRGLWEKGCSVTMYERQDQSQELGFGFIILANGLAAIKALGITANLADYGCSITRALIQTTTGIVLADQQLTGAVAVSRF